MDERIAMLADARRRATLRYLRGSENGAVSLHDIVTYVTTDGPLERPGAGRQDELAVALHHVHLPKLDDAGLVEYDPVDRTARYRSDDRVEAMLDTLAQFD